MLFVLLNSLVAWIYELRKYTNPVYFYLGNLCPRPGGGCCVTTPSKLSLQNLKPVGGAVHRRLGSHQTLYGEDGDVANVA